VNLSLNSVYISDISVFLLAFYKLVGYYAPMWYDNNTAFFAQKMQESGEYRLKYTSYHSKRS
jgi:hypothetical protein